MEFCKEGLSSVRQTSVSSENQGPKPAEIVPVETMPEDRPKPARARMASTGNSRDGGKVRVVQSVPRGGPRDAPAKRPSRAPRDPTIRYSKSAEGLRHEALRQYPFNGEKLSAAKAFGDPDFIYHGGEPIQSASTVDMAKRNKSGSIKAIFGKVFSRNNEQQRPGSRQGSQQIDNTRVNPDTAALLRSQTLEKEASKPTPGFSGSERGRKTSVSSRVSSSADMLWDVPRVEFSNPNSSVPNLSAPKPITPRPSRPWLNLKEKEGSLFTSFTGSPPTPPLPTMNPEGNSSNEAVADSASGITVRKAPASPQKGRPSRQGSRRKARKRDSLEALRTRHSSSRERPSKSQEGAQASAGQEMKSSKGTIQTTAASSKHPSKDSTAQQDSHTAKKVTSRETDASRLTANTNNTISTWTTNTLSTQTSRPSTAPRQAMEAASLFARVSELEARMAYVEQTLGAFVQEHYRRQNYQQQSRKSKDQGLVSLQHHFHTPPASQPGEGNGDTWLLNDSLPSSAASSAPSTPPFSADAFPHDTEKGIFRMSDEAERVDGAPFFASDYPKDRLVGHPDYRKGSSAISPMQTRTDRPLEDEEVEGDTGLAGAHNMLKNEIETLRTDFDDLQQQTSLYTDSAAGRVYPRIHNRFHVHPYTEAEAEASEAMPKDGQYELPRSRFSFYDSDEEDEEQDEEEKKEAVEIGNEDNEEILEMREVKKTQQEEDKPVSSERDEREAEANAQEASYNASSKVSSIDDDDSWKKPTEASISAAMLPMPPASSPSPMASYSPPSSSPLTKTSATIEPVSTDLRTEQNTPYPQEAQ